MSIIKYAIAIAMISLISFDSQALCLTKKCRENKQIGEQVAAEGENCDSLTGKAKRACKKAVAKTARAEAKEQCGGGLFKGGKCRREVRRDMKAQQGAFRGIGAKTANAEGRENFEKFRDQKKELKAMVKNGEISADDYKKMIKQAKNDRIKANNKVGRNKAIKTASVIGGALVGGAGGAGRGGSGDESPA